ncbi:MAG: hypothetical protein SP1CHLAM54_11030 [Chlamydiia bacterium]|nr:hypothetical protein [Chlamydiia bacterium]MCH9616008.1 hypothetical protein [Chlamydiia bacterium]MCH9629031.1 hypothetical protein [Chlamydiia bacterium]
MLDSLPLKEIAIFDGIMLGLSYFSRLVYKRLLPKIKKSKLVWGQSLLKAIHFPFQLLILGLACTTTIRLIVSINMGMAQKIVVIFCVTLFLIRFITQLEENMQKMRKKLDKMTARALSQVSRVCVLVIGVLIAVQTLGVSISAVLAFGGAGALAVALAAKDILGNFFGGLMIFMDRPFAVGDWIKSEKNGIEGTVEHIGYRLTRIRTFEKRPLYIPNGMLSTICIENPSRMSNRRIKTSIGIRYEDSGQMRSLLEEIREYLENHQDIAQDKIILVNFNDFGPSSLNIMIYCFTRTTDWSAYLKVQEKVYLDILDMIENRGAQVAYPTRVIHSAPTLALADD